MTVGLRYNDHNNNCLVSWVFLAVWVRAVERGHRKAQYCCWKLLVSPSVRNVGEL